MFENQPDFQSAFQTEAIQNGFDESLKMPYITSIEMNAKIEEAQKAVLAVIDARFGNVPYAVNEKIRYCDDVNKLESALRLAATISSLDQFKI